MFTLTDGRNYLWQWDMDRQVRVSDTTITEVHFCNRTGDCSLVVEVKDGLANIPNILLQDNRPIRVYAYCDCYTKEDTTFEVKPRTKPSDYVYTETEIKRYEDFDARLTYLEQNGVPTEVTEQIEANTENIQEVTERIENVETDIEVLKTGSATAEFVESYTIPTFHLDFSNATGENQLATAEMVRCCAHIATAKDGSYSPVNIVVKTASDSYKKATYNVRAIRSSISGTSLQYVLLEVYLEPDFSVYNIADKQSIKCTTYYIFYPYEDPNQDSLYRKHGEREFTFVEQSEVEALKNDIDDSYYLDCYGVGTEEQDAPESIVAFANAVATDYSLDKGTCAYVKDSYQNKYFPALIDVTGTGEIHVQKIGFDLEDLVYNRAIAWTELSIYKSSDGVWKYKNIGSYSYKFVSASELSSYARKEDIPPHVSKLSQLQNDVGFAYRAELGDFQTADQVQTMINNSIGVIENGSY